ncbi:hypothetical protein [Gordonia humi]|uniref:DNA-directed RNA polymerase subunit RPC12/RpoP n=1 Tax=Gordonia humi TaxID=686429 RepID=A0A840F184_9ACTN|nr:hypothetical protein [Gordonia humi]MBB4136374.1 DNA-directed RNA polymerase subunit RPC12/RpoP [Gordonia humi]
MLCPHCGVDVLYRERPDRTCGKCGRVFAFEPRTSRYRLHDTRALRLAARLRTDENYRFTYEQLHYLLGKKGLDRRIDSAWRSVFWGTPAVIVALTIVPGMPLTFGLGVAALRLDVGLAVGWLFGTSATLIVLSLIVNGLCRPSMLRDRRITMEYSAAEFAEQFSTRWRSVYGHDLPGVVDERRAPIRQPEHPRYTVLCPDRSVLVCLASNAISQTRALALVSHPDQAPPDTPVLVVHDASPAGVHLVAEARRRFGSHAVDVGLSPTTVRESGTALPQLREPTLAPEVAASLPPDLSDDDRAWLEIGWWSPVAAVPPRRLIAAVDRAVDRFEPATAAARSVGFLTWPTV